MKPHVLILEDNFLLAEDLADLVRTDLGGAPLLAHNVSEAIELIPDNIKLAFLDIEVSDGVSYPVAKKLMEHHIPIIFVSGNEKENVPREFKYVPFVSKPASPSRLI